MSERETIEIGRVEHTDELPLVRQAPQPSAAERVRMIAATANGTGNSSGRQQLGASSAGATNGARPKPAPRHHRRAPLVERILERSSEPFVPLTLGGQSIVELAPGATCVLVAGAKRGKTSLAACIAVEHALERGPAVIMSLELPGRELAARIVGSRTDASWPDVLRGRVARQHMLDAIPERLVIVDREDATLDMLDSVIDALAAEYPGQPILAATDYLQLLDSDERDIRARVDDAMRRHDKIVRASRAVVVGLLLSQSSRAASRQLTSGERIGAEAADAGAESAAIERWASAIIAIGTLGTPAEDGSQAAELSCAANRMARGDIVWPARADLRTGRWRLAGDARAATEVKAERAAARDESKVNATALAIPALLEKSSEPMSRREILAELGGKEGHVRAAVLACLNDAATGVVEVGPKVGGHWKVWTLRRAEQHGRTIRPRGIE